MASTPYATPILNQPYVTDRLGAVEMKAPADGIYSVIVQATVTPPSGLFVNVNVASVDVYDNTDIQNTGQQAVQFKTGFLANAGDKINVTLASNDPNDKNLNVIKAIISIQQGF